MNAEDYTTQRLRAMTDAELDSAMKHWQFERATLLWRNASTFRLRQAKRVIDRIKREYERRGLRAS